MKQIEHHARSAHSSRPAPALMQCRPVHMLALLMLLPLMASAQQAPSIPAPNPEQQGLPLNWRLAPHPLGAPQAPAAAAGSSMPDQVLPSPIAKIDWRAPRFGPQIEALLQPFVGQARLSGQALEQARGQIWNLYRQHGRLARVEILALGRPGGSVLQVTVTEIRVHAVRVAQEGSGTVEPGLLDDILAEAKAELAQGSVFDLDALDSRVKRRLFLADVNLRAILVPVGDDQLDVELQVRALGASPAEWVLQYDMSGMRAYGRDRYTGGVGMYSLLTPGDRLNLLVTKSTGMKYGRFGYEIPLTGMGARLAIWSSYVDYRAPAGVEGQVGQLGAGLSYPLYYGNAAIWTGYLDYIDSRQRDHIGWMQVNDKSTTSVQARAEANFLLGPTQSAHLSLALQQGRLDLSALPSAQAQDRLSARSEGDFTKFNWDASWSGAYGPGTRYDVRLQAKGQAAWKNLDESAKFALGGPTGVRAYGSSVAMGDSGYLINTELGYRPTPNLRLYGFHDRGRVRPYRQPWVPGNAAPTFALQGIGVGASYSYRSLTGVIVYAHQLGANPTLASNGRDAEGRNDRNRLWLTLTAQF